MISEHVQTSNHILKNGPVPSPKLVSPKGNLYVSGVSPRGEVNHVSDSTMFVPHLQPTLDAVKIARDCPGEADFYIYKFALRHRHSTGKGSLQKKKKLALTPPPKCDEKPSTLFGQNGLFRR